MADIVLAFGGARGVSVRKEGSRYGVFFDGKPLDWFPSYEAALPLTQDLSISRVATEQDPIIGQIKFCSGDLDQGHVIVVGKSKDGYVVQQIGGAHARFEVLADELEEPLDIPFTK